MAIIEKSAQGITDAQVQPIDFDAIELAKNFTFEEYATTIATASNLCFDDDGKFITFMPEIALLYSVLLYLSNVDKEQLTLENLFQLKMNRGLHGSFVINELAEKIERTDMYSCFYEELGKMNYERKNGRGGVLNRILEDTVEGIGGEKIFSTLLKEILFGMLEGDSASGTGGDEVTDGDENEVTAEANTTTEVAEDSGVTEQPSEVQDIMNAFKQKPE